MIDLLQVNLAELTDDEDQGLLAIIITDASNGGEEQWEPYYKPLLELVNSRLHGLDTDENHFLARGNGATGNILYNAALNGLPWYGLQSICKVNVDSLIVQHGECGLYPFMLPSVTMKEDEDDIPDLAGSDELSMRIDLTYQMLLMRPDVIKIATSHKA